MLLFSDEYEILYPQYLLEGNGLFKMRLFAILFVYNNTYNISNIINEDINGEPINLVIDVSLMQSNCSGSSMERCSKLPVPGTFQPNASGISTAYVSFQTLSMCKDRGQHCVALVDHARTEEVVQSCKMWSCFVLLQYLFSVILDEGQDMMLNNFVPVLNSFKISSS